MIRIASLSIVGVVGYAVWAVMAYYDPAQRPDFLKFNVMMATGVVALILRDMKS